MGDAPRFDLLLLGYRDDLARERALALLRHLPQAGGGPFDVRRDTELPHRMGACVDHDLGLRLVAELRRLGAQVRLVEGEAGQEADAVPAPATPHRRVPSRSRALLLLVVLLALAAVYAQPGVRRPALPPQESGQTAAIAVGQPDIPLRRHGLNDEAVELNAAGRFAEAAERLRAAIEKNPYEETLHYNLQIVLRNWAVVEINAGRPDVAVGLLEEALDEGEEPDLLALLGVAYARTSDWPAAQDTLERAVQLGAADLMAFVALGKVYRQQGDRQGAVEMFQRARASGAAGAQFTAMLERFERELDAEWDYDEFSTPHFQIAFSQGEDRHAAQIVSAVLEDAYFAVGRKLHLYLPDRTQVVLYPSEDFHAVTQTPDWTGGVYDGKIKLPVRGIEENDPLLDRTLRHEFGHVLVAFLSRGKAPVWLNEGVAIWTEEEVDGDREDWAFRTIAGRHLFRLDELAGPFTKLPAARVHLAYAQSYLVVRGIVAQFGERRLRALLAAIGAGNSTAAAFDQVLSTQLVEFEGRLVRELTS